MEHDKLIEKIRQYNINLPNIKWNPERLKQWLDGYIACQQDIIAMIAKERDNENRSNKG